MTQVLQLAQCLHLDAMVEDVHARVIRQPWTGEGLSRLLMVLGSLSVPDIKALLHHPKAFAFTETQVACM